MGKGKARLLKNSGNKVPWTVVIMIEVTVKNCSDFVRVLEIDRCVSREVLREYNKNNSREERLSSAHDFRGYSLFWWSGYEVTNSLLP